MSTHVHGLRINHLEVTIPRGSLAQMLDDLLAFYCKTLGFGHTRIPKFGDAHVFLTTDTEGSQFIYIAEHAEPMIVRGEDHLGFHVESREAVDRMLDACKSCQRRDARMQIRELEDLDLAQTLTHAFYFRYLLPIWFDVQFIGYKPGFEPRRKWSFG